MQICRHRGLYLLMCTGPKAACVVIFVRMSKLLHTIQFKVNLNKYRSPCTETIAANLQIPTLGSKVQMKVVCQELTTIPNYEKGVEYGV